LFLVSTTKYAYHNKFFIIFLILNFTIGEAFFISLFHIQDVAINIYVMLRSSMFHVNYLS
ncbi:hypothetical protein ACJX0J_011222, partial [Zea mays]